MGSDYELVPHDEAADEVIQRGGKPVIGPAEVGPDTFQQLVDYQWNSPNRIFALDKSGQARHFPWEDMVHNAMLSNQRNDRKELWNPHPVDPNIEAMYGHESGQGYIPQDLIEKFLRLNAERDHVRRMLHVQER